MKPWSKKEGHCINIDISMLPINYKPLFLFLVLAFDTCTEAR